MKKCKLCFLFPICDDSTSVSINRGYCSDFLPHNADESEKKRKVIDILMRADDE